MTYRIRGVDDEPDITALLAYHLAKAGFRVSTAANGPDARKAALSQVDWHYVSAVSLRPGKRRRPRRFDSFMRITPTVAVTST